jgi:hypothetical protein
MADIYEWSPNCSFHFLVLIFGNDPPAISQDHYIQRVTALSKMIWRAASQRSAKCASHNGQTQNGPSSAEVSERINHEENQFKFWTRNCSFKGSQSFALVRTVEEFERGNNFLKQAEKTFIGNLVTRGRKFAEMKPFCAHHFANIFTTMLQAERTSISAFRWRGFADGYRESGLNPIDAVLSQDLVADRMYLTLGSLGTRQNRRHHRADQARGLEDEARRVSGDSEKPDVVMKS